MRLMIDTNILLDVLMKREEYYQDSSVIWKCCETNLYSGFVSVLSIANLIYIMRKQMSPESIADVIETLGMIFRFEDLTASDLKKAAGWKWLDFEDALQTTTAERIQADFIISRNIKDFSGSMIPVLTPDAFLKQIV